MTCLVNSCSRKHYAKGFCEKHYQRTKKGHNPLTERSIFELSEKERFLSKVDVRSDDQCWPWLAGIKSKKTGFTYGSYYFRSKHDLAHRASYYIFNGDIPEGMFVCHKCDNPICVNPNHLFIGFPVDNTQDKFIKGRANMPKGEQRSKVLKDSDVIAIRDMAQTMSYKEIALLFPISPSSIRDIIKIRTWKHI